MTALYKIFEQAIAGPIGAANDDAVNDVAQSDQIADQWIDTQHFTLEAPETLDPYLSSQVVMVLSLIEHLEHAGVSQEDIQLAWSAGGLDNHFETLISLRDLAQDHPDIAIQFEEGINQHFGLPKLSEDMRPEISPVGRRDYDYDLDNTMQLGAPRFA